MKSETNFSINNSTIFDFQGNNYLVFKFRGINITKTAPNKKRGTYYETAKFNF